MVMKMESLPSSDGKKVGIFFVLLLFFIAILSSLINRECLRNLVERDIVCSIIDHG